MALDPLATVDDLPAGALGTPEEQAAALEVASALIRDAAGCPISQVTATILLVADSANLVSLPIPTSEVASVTPVGGSALSASSYVAMPEGLWSSCGWGYGPTPLHVDCTFGLPVVPPDIVDLAVALAMTWLQHHINPTSESPAGVTSIRLDDAAETYSDEHAGQVTPVYVPEKTADWLRQRFGGGVTVVSTL